MAEDVLKKTGEAGGSGDPKEVLRAYILDIETNLIKKLDNQDERERFTVDIITGFMKKITELKDNIDPYIRVLSGIDSKNFESMLNGLRDAEINLGEARKIRGLKGVMTKPCHKQIKGAVSILEQSLKRPREAIK